MVRSLVRTRLMLKPSATAAGGLSLRSLSTVFAVAKARPADRIMAALVKGDGHEALRLASGFQHLGDHAVAITRGWTALKNPQFYRELGRDPEQIIAVGIAAVKARFHEYDVNCLCKSCQQQKFE